MDTGDCQPLYHAIRDFYEGLNMKIDQQIPMLLVERHALNEAIVGEKGVSDTFLYVYAIFRFFCFVLFCGNPLIEGMVLFRVFITCLKQGVYAFLKSRLSPV